MACRGQAHPGGASPACGAAWGIDAVNEQAGIEAGSVLESNLG